MAVFKTTDKLPEDCTYVLAHYTRGNWLDSDDPEGVTWVVAKFVRGISEEERADMPECKRKRIHKQCDEGFNNKKPYYWTTFGTLSLFGQDVDMWAELPSV